MTQLVADEQEALKELVKSCCPKQALGGGSDPATGDAGSWCSSVGRAVTYDLRQWYSDICHVAPNVCDKDGHLRRLVLPPYALQCPSFPQVMLVFRTPLCNMPHCSRAQKQLLPRLLATIIAPRQQ